jgi:hypothetical protein
MPPLKKLYSSFILFIIGAFILKTRIKTGDGCQGMMEGIQFIFFFAVYILTLFIILAYSIFKYLKTETDFNFYPLWTTVIVILCVFFSFNIDKFEDPIRLQAEINKSDGHNLILNENGKFKITLRATEWSCFYKGEYHVKNDTLILSRPDIQTLTDSIFADKYLIDVNKKMLFPLDRSDFLKDTTRWLTIKDEKE